jgi:hypothetical protein
MPYRRVLQRHYSRYLADIKLRQFIIRSETDTDRRLTAEADLWEGRLAHACRPDRLFAVQLRDRIYRWDRDRGCDNLALARVEFKPFLSG